MSTEDQRPARPEIGAPVKKRSNWNWLAGILLIFFSVKLMGFVGAIVAFGGYYLLRPKLGLWGAVAAAGVLGLGASVLLFYLTN